LHLPAVVHGPLPKNLPQFEGIDYPIGGKPTLPVEATPLEIAEEREEFYGGGEQAAGVEAKPASKEEEDGTIRETR
jgi:hypothetical protein